jgi:hypothetical protein
MVNSGLDVALVAVAMFTLAFVIAEAIEPIPVFELFIEGFTLVELEAFFGVYELCRRIGDGHGITGLIVDVGFIAGGDVFHLRGGCCG